LKNFPWAYTRDRKPVRAGDLKAQGAMTALEKVALDIPSKPDMRQRLTQAGFEMTAKDGKSQWNASPASCRCSATSSPRPGSRNSSP